MQFNTPLIISALWAGSCHINKPLTQLLSLVSNLDTHFLPVEIKVWTLNSEKLQYIHLMGRENGS